MADNTLNFLQEEFDAINAQLSTSKQIQTDADKKVAQSVETSANRDKIVIQSNELIDTRKQLVSNSSDLSSIAAEMDAAIQTQQKQVSAASGINVKTAEVAEQYNANARQNYTDHLNNPVVDQNVKRYNDQINVYSAKIAQLENDTSFLGSIKRQALLPINQRNLAQARNNLKAAQGRKIAAVETFNSSLKGNQLFARSTTAVERATMADNLVRSESALKVLTSEATVTQADRQVLMDTLQLDAAKLGLYEKEYAFLKERGLATNSNMAALQTKLNAQMTQENAAKKGQSAEQRQMITSEWESFIRDSIPQEDEQSKLIKQMPNPLDPITVNSSLGQVFWAARGKRGTQNEFAQTAIGKRNANTPLSAEESVALQLIDAGTANARQAAITAAELTIQGDRKNEKAHLAARDEKLKKLQDPAEQAKFYAAAMAGMKKDATAGIMSGAIIIPDTNKELQDPSFPYSSMISERFKKIMNGENWVSINLGMTTQGEPKQQLQGISAGIIDYLHSTTASNLGTVTFDEDTNNTLDVVSQGLADYYKYVRTMNNETNAGIGSGILPAIMIPNVGIGGASFNMENKAQWDTLLRLGLQKKSNASTGSTLNTLLTRGGL